MAEKTGIEKVIEKIKADREKIRKAETYYGIKYGTFAWVRGTIDIYDLDDLDYIKICLDKMGERLLKESKEKIKKNER